VSRQPDQKELLMLATIIAASKVCQPLIIEMDGKRAAVDPTALQTLAHAYVTMVATAEVQK
jgi:hypothetical protein